MSTGGTWHATVGLVPGRRIQAARDMTTKERTMYFENLTNRDVIPALVNMLTFAEARHRMIANNVANLQTPGFKTRQLDAKAFQRALRRALDEKGSDVEKPFVVEATREFGTQEDGHLRVTPSQTPVRNVLFHDGTNGSIDRLMADLSENAMVHQAASTLLKGSFDELRKAIRGHV